MKKITLILFFCCLCSCEYIQQFTNKTTQTNEPIVASVGEKNLYVSDIKNVMPKDISLQDSLVFVKAFVNSWAKQQLLLQKAEENISEVNNNEIQNLVENYRKSLFINGYKERLIKQRLDTVVQEEELVKYYQNNKENFKLTAPIIQYKYLHYGKDFLDKKEVEKKFKSSKEEDLADLELNLLNYKDYHLRDSTWFSVNEVLTKIPVFKNEPKDKLLKISKFIQKEDSLGVYLIAVNNVLKRNTVAPLSYIEPKITRLILHKRKKELIRDIEKTLINDAIKNNTFKEY